MNDARREAKDAILDVQSRWIAKAKSDDSRQAGVVALTLILDQLDLDVQPVDAVVMIQALDDLADSDGDTEERIALRSRLRAFLRKTATA